MNSVKPHPIYKSYGYDEATGKIMNIETKHEMVEQQHHSGYMRLSFGYSSHRFIWECNNDVIPKGYEIDHINHDKEDNRLSNLRCVSVSQNRKNRDHTRILQIAKVAHSLRKSIKAISKDDINLFYFFKSKNQCAKYFNISPAMVYLIIEKTNNVKFAHTSLGDFYFEYANENDVTQFIIIPDARIKNEKKFSEIRNEKHMCICGRRITLNGKAQHEKTSIHQEYLKQQAETI